MVPILICRLHSLPQNISFDEGALAEPLSVLIHAFRRAAFSAGQTVLVYGVGTIGLLACALAKARGCSRVVAVDINQARLSFAKRHGFAEDVFCLPATPKAKSPEDQLRRARENADRILEAFGEDNGFDVVFECTGAESCIQMAIHVRKFPPVFPGCKVN
jgi:L-iditol 2-dehydrogenase